MALFRGDVVALRRASTAFVWRTQGDSLWLIPVWGCNGPPRHRAEVRIEDLNDIIACGISIKLPVARCHDIYQLQAAKLAKPEPIGRAPSGLLARLVAAVTREAQAQAQEARHTFNVSALGMLRVA